MEVTKVRLFERRDLTATLTPEFMLANARDVCDAVTVIPEVAIVHLKDNGQGAYTLEVQFKDDLRPNDGAKPASGVGLVKPISNRQEPLTVDRGKVAALVAASHPLIAQVSLK